MSDSNETVTQIKDKAPAIDIDPILTPRRVGRMLQSVRDHLE